MTKEKRPMFNTTIGYDDRAADGTTEKRLLTVLINWHEEDQTLKCLGRLHAQQVPGMEILVIDNEGTADTRTALHAKSDLFQYYHQFDRNVGFTGACNFGLEYAKDRGFCFVLWFNDDAVPEQGCLAELLAVIESDIRIAMVSPVLRDPETKKPHFCGAVLDADIPGMLYLKFEDILGPNPPTNCYLYGTALLARTNAVHAAGGFHSGYFAYWEDMELSGKMLKAGYQCRIVPTAAVDHINQHGEEIATFRSRYYYYYMTRNEIHFWRHTLSGVRLLRALYWHWRRVRKRMFLLTASGHRAEIIALRHGLKDGVLGRYGRWRLHPPKRPQLEHGRSHTDGRA
jgi:GT2 family glycosyltransferase